MKKSLVKKSTECLGSPAAPISYAIHNLQLNYMLENCEDIKARHKRLVDCYKKTCDKGTVVFNGREVIVITTARSDVYPVWQIDNAMYLYCTVHVYLYISQFT